MLTQEFCDYLERQMSEALLTAQEVEKRGYWCDGILLPASQEAYSLKKVNDSRSVTTSAWIARGATQEQYECVLKFGKYALRRYAKGTPLTDCVPSPATADWIMLNTQKKYLEVQLR